MKLVWLCTIGITIRGFHCITAWNVFNFFKYFMTTIISSYNWRQNAADFWNRIFRRNAFVEQVHIQQLRTALQTRHLRPRRRTLLRPSHSHWTKTARREVGKNRKKVSLFIYLIKSKLLINFVPRSFYNLKAFASISSLWFYRQALG